jgi:hypothetical protein
MSEIRKLLNDNVSLPLWPETGKVLGLRRGATYAAARSGEIKTIRFGRLLKVPTAWLRRKLELVEPVVNSLSSAEDERTQNGRAQR